MYEFTNEQTRNNEYTFCYDCQRGNEECNNCTYFENETHLEMKGV